jgi:hypothetical protein
MAVFVCLESCRGVWHTDGLLESFTAAQSSVVYHDAVTLCLPVRDNCLGM